MYWKNLFETKALILDGHSIVFANIKLIFFKAWAKKTIIQSFSITLQSQSGDRWVGVGVNDGFH